MSNISPKSRSKPPSSSPSSSSLSDRSDVVVRYDDRGAVAAETATPLENADGANADEDDRAERATRTMTIFMVF